ncbi:SusC/RagA family TonB-linked outer membrane protein [Flavobacterium johnsoniae]|uniref:SusC-like TonB-dependent receptor n=1 Tax=Flavobacterium johnsoniae (strain ATCC 17061 / DSM 2064 / JCM 8514 / BCRC 14874 / CCUG 350202 / NBRC 14942 / NCIMB 11054 / UW101) TaxID=376686 RepID=A5FH56_FLAJ1|nr:TonB-dependent receptor [Flavobacterium johnsoniae]ABQ05458.1 SusC-like TonB-dependent receptor [Flavobacterium johnsoniae UW101]OXE96808.1 SusC/RagA family TonB-linked outer membrane protein [Flavobacterium johnsoniae UW101]WQG82740.1 TonB-dependent receptor [Flavobacterium johnsoniae UW101]SHL56451.1 TonB-linked outer membrane protein, SusC/RagA family [Flavobacterium johnsoniae]
MKSKLLLTVLLLFTSFAFSQNLDVSGTVLDASGLSLPGVNVKVKNSSKSTTTDFDGSFKLTDVPKGTVIVFSYIGYRTQEAAVSGTKMTVKMSDDAKSLDEVVVIGYGTQKKREVTGSVAVVDSKTLDVLKPARIEQALQGTVSGVNVTTQSGAPGAPLDIRIRGIATNGENRPTVIIDGYVGDLGLLNPNDIETITVLKDAQAAIYGTIGANGIILVTTKMGKKNSQTRVSFNSYAGFQQTSRKLPTLNATEYALLLNESYANGGRPLPYPNVSSLGKGTNWQDEVFQNAPIINNDLTISGGSDKITYSISGSHLDQEGIVGGDKSGFLRNTARIGLGADLSDKIKLKTNVIYTYFTRNTLNENGLGSVLFNALNVPATLSPYDANGDFTLVPSTAGLGTEIINPLAQIANTYNDYNYKKLNGNFGLDYKIFKGFTLSSSIGFNTSNSESKTFNKQISYGGKVFDVQRSSVTQGAVNDNNYSFDLFGTYNAKIAQSHNITGTIGTTIFKEWGNGLTATGFDVPNNVWENADISLTKGTSETLTNSSYVYDQRRLSYFGRLQYDYKGKYLLSAMLRRDSSTKFGPGNKVGYFPSFTAGWVVSDESFFGQPKFVNFLKFRASYGTLGNDQIPNYGYLGLLNGEATYIFNGALVNGTANGQVPNPNLKWEEAQKFDVGLDLKILNDKVFIVADYFIDTRKDLLIPNIPVSGINGTGAPGASAPTLNAGTVKNSGFEFSIDYKDKISDALTFSVGYNVTFLKNKVTEVNNGTGFIEGGAFGVGQPAPSRMEVGKPMGYFYGYKTDGIFQTQAEVDAHPSQVALGANAAPGDIRYVDLNGDGVIDTKDKTDIGNPIPDATMGFNLQLNYKSLDFAVFTFASVGNDMVRNYERTLSDANRINYVLDRWTGPGTSNSTPRVTTGATSNNVFSNYFVEDASYVRIQNVQLGYTLNPEISKRAGVSKLRLYAGVNNLYTFTKYKGFDPGASNGAPIGGGIDYGFYPIPRTYLMGLNINF